MSWNRKNTRWNTIWNVCDPKVRVKEKVVACHYDSYPYGAHTLHNPSTGL